MKLSTHTLLVLALSLPLAHLELFSQGGQTGGNERPNHELFKVQDLVSHADASSSGDLVLSIPLMTVRVDIGMTFRYYSSGTNRLIHIDDAVPAGSSAATSTIRARTTTRTMPAAT